MKKTIYGRLLAFGFIVSAAFGCVNRQSASEPEAGIFGQYVRAYTAGIVDSTAAIRIELVETPTEQPASGLFSIKPHVSGTTLWENGNTVVFKPKALVPGENYEISFALRKVSGADKDFKFGISVRKALKDQEALEEPGTGFRVRRCRLNDSHIDLIFSETPTNAATRGMVELEGVARSYVQVQDSAVAIVVEHGDVLGVLKIRGFGTLPPGPSGIVHSIELPDEIIRKFPPFLQCPSDRLLSGG